MPAQVRGARAGLPVGSSADTVAAEVELRHRVRRSSSSVQLAHVQQGRLRPDAADAAEVAAVGTGRFAAPLR